MFVAILFAVVRPYRKLSHNIIDCVFMIYLGIYFNIQNEVLLTQYYSQRSDITASAFSILLALPLFYPIFLSLRVLYQSSAMQRVRKKCSRRAEQIMIPNGSIYGSLPALVNWDWPPTHPLCCKTCSFTIKTLYSPTQCVFGLSNIKLLILELHIHIHTYIIIHTYEGGRSFVYMIQKFWREIYIYKPELNA